MTRPSDTPFRTFFLGRLVPEQQQKLARGLHSKIQLSNLRLLPTAELALGEPISIDTLWRLGMGPSLLDRLFRLPNWRAVRSWRSAALRLCIDQQALAG